MCDGFWNHTTTVVLLPWISTFCKVNHWLLSIFYGVAFVIIQEISMWEWFTQHGYSSWVHPSWLWEKHDVWWIEDCTWAMCDMMFAVNIICILPCAIHETMVHVLQDNISLLLSLFQLVQSKPVQKSTGLRHLVWVWNELKKEFRRYCDVVSHTKVWGIGFISSWVCG
jgi:hypothetical protein